MERNNVQAINNALKKAMREDDKIVIFGEDVGNVGGVFRATKGLQKEFGSTRCFDAPIAEASLMGIALGMAVNGLRPVLEIQFQGFIYPAFQQLMAHIARFRNRSRGRFICPVVVRMPVGS
jgi:pyruvate dehydrogenase E1 component beta subunit